MFELYGIQWSEKKVKQSKTFVHKSANLPLKNKTLFQCELCDCVVAGDYFILF